jgi:YegS/Rv2252/BmrU family lipid kinase
MHAALIYNPSSGMGQDRSALDMAIRALRALGWDTTERDTHARGEAFKFAREAAEQGYEAAFAVGGDGTLNEVSNGVLDTPTAVGVLPYGTANVWALEMGLPLNDLAGAAAVQAQAPVRAIDVGIVTGKGFGPRAFLLSCGVGFDATVIREVEAQRSLKRRWGKLLFVAYGVRKGLQYRGRRVNVTVDGETHRRRILLALTSNAQLYGAAFRFPPDARIDDGLLDVTVLEGENALHTAWHFIRLGAGLYETSPDVQHWRGREISLSGASLPVHADAEPVGSTPIEIRVKPGALRVFVPGTANRSLFSPRKSAATSEST